MDKIKLGFAMCGSFCTIPNALVEMERLASDNYDIYPIFSPIVYDSDTRFTKSKDLKERVEEITGKKIINTITEAEPIGPKKMFDVLVVCPCTSNTLAKLTYGITDTSVTMAVKSHLRNNRPVVIAVSTNDGLAGNAKNIGTLLGMKNYYFVPFRQDDSAKKPFSLVADFSLVNETVACALDGIQIQPILL